MIESGFEEAERAIECKIFGWQQNFILFCVQRNCFVFTSAVGESDCSVP